jgi:phenylacetate-coenzyme A ligase PaaK-like adenylate-forming protein
MKHNTSRVLSPLDIARLVKYARDVWRVDRRGQDLVAARQRTRLARMVAFARTHSPYYQKLYRALAPVVTDIREMPVTTKAELMDGFDSWVTDRAVTRQNVDAFIADVDRVGDLFHGRYAVWTTSGTTGKPGVFLHDSAAMMAYGALAVRNSGGLSASLRHFATVFRRGVRFAVVVATGGHFASAAGAALAQKSLAWPGQRYQAFSVLDPLPTLVHDLNAFQPTDLMGYPSAIALLAQEQREGRLAIHPFSITCNSEGLESSARRLIAEAFDCPVQDMYGASEFPAIALECPHQHLHVNADWVIVEPVDDRYRPVPPGVPSRTTLITNLANRVAPLLRYDLGDSITCLDAPCPCGSALPVIRVEGRSNDILLMQARDGSEIAILPLALETIVEETPGVESFQVIQTGTAELGIRLTVQPGQDKHQVWMALAERVHGFLACQGLAEVAVRLDPTPPGRDPGSGKMHQISVAENVRKYRAARQAPPIIAGPSKSTLERVRG